MPPTPIRQFLHATPFRPFRVRLADGRSYEVKHPDYAFLSPSGRLLHVYLNEDDFEMLDVFLILGVETNDAVAPPAS